MRTSLDYTVLNAAAATGAGAVINVQDFKTVTLSFATDGGGTAALTVKFAGSIQEVPPNFAAAQSASNQFDYIDVIDLQNGASIDGDTGIAVATADDYRLFEINTNGLKWITAVVTARTAGSVTVKARTFTDN